MSQQTSIIKRVPKEVWMEIGFFAFLWLLVGLRANVTVNGEPNIIGFIFLTFCVSFGWWFLMNLAFAGLLWVFEKIMERISNHE